MSYTRAKYTFWYLVQSYVILISLFSFLLVLVLHLLTLARQHKSQRVDELELLLHYFEEESAVCVCDERLTCLRLCILLAIFFYACKAHATVFFLPRRKNRWRLGKKNVIFLKIKIASKWKTNDLLDFNVQRWRSQIFDQLDRVGI